MPFLCHSLMLLVVGWLSLLLVHCLFACSLLFVVAIVVVCCCVLAIDVYVLAVALN